MKKLLMVVMASYALTARAQMHESKNFLYLYSDSVIHARTIKLRPDFAGYWQLRADSRRIPTEQVKFFNNEDGFFANTRRLKLGGETSFSERIVEGRINVFQEMTYDPFLHERGPRYRLRREPVVDFGMYYNKGFGDLKKVNYNNLRRDIADHPESIDLLNNYRKSMTTSKMLYTAAGVSIVAGLVSFLVAGSSDGLSSSFGDNKFGASSMSSGGANFTSSFVLLGLGAGLAIGGYYVQISGSRKLENVIDSYNR
jgi:hypothetical protein